MSNEPDVIKINGLDTRSGTKTPFLIGVAGGTASGKVYVLCLQIKFCANSVLF